MLFYELTIGDAALLNNNISLTLKGIIYHVKKKQQFLKHRNTLVIH